MKVRTERGWAVIASDEVYRYDLLEKGVMARLYTTPGNLVAATDRLAAAGSSPSTSPRSRRPSGRPARPGSTSCARSARRPSKAIAPAAAA